MRKLTTFLSIVLAGVMITGCSNSKKSEFEGIPVQELYDKGQTYLQEGDYTSAIRYLEAVDIRAQSGYAEQVQLGLILAEYKTGEYYKALDAAERFVRSFPNSSQMDYVYYLAGLSNVRLGDNWIQDFFGVNEATRSVENIRNAYGSFQTLVQYFPHSHYLKQSQEWMAYLKERLAQHELGIVKFYTKRDAHVAVANRVDEMIRFYPDSKATSEALPLLKQAYEKMGIKDSAAAVQEVIDANKNREFPPYKKPSYGEQF